MLGLRAFAGWGSTPDQRTVYDGWIADSQYARATEQRNKEWERRSTQSGYHDYTEDLKALNAQSRLQKQWEAENAAYQAKEARREMERQARAEEQRAQRALFAMYDAAEAGDADARMKLGQYEESSAFFQWGIPRYQMVFGPRRPEALWKVVALLRAHADEADRLTSFRPVESFLAELAAGGDVVAARQAGEFWISKEDPFRAARFFAQAAEGGDLAAQQGALRLLARDKVDALPADPAAVIAWSRAAAQREEIDGQFLLGRSLCEGRDVTRDAAEGIFLLKRAATNNGEMSDADATRVRQRAAELAGLVLRDGAGVPAEAKAGIALLRTAAVQGSDSAQLALGQTYLLGLGVPADRAQALPWLRTAAEKGNAQAASLLATACLRPEATDDEQLEGLSWLRRAAKRRPEAMLAYGRILFAGDYGVEADVEEALRYFGLAIQRYPNDSGVLDFVGDAYLHGSYGLRANPAEGVRLLKQAAVAGHARSALRLEAAYRAGDGVARDAMEADRWRARAGGG